MTSFYVADGSERYLSQPCTAGPWGPDNQHGGPPAALVTRALEELVGDRDRVVGRLTMELLGPVPVGPLQVRTKVLRPGRSVEMCEATIVDEERGRACVRAVAWMFPASGSGPVEGVMPPGHSPDDGADQGWPGSWLGGYLDAVDWRWIKGAVDQPGPGTVWMRPNVTLVDGEAMSPVQRLMACVDSASGVSAVLDPGDWAFLNTELTVHVLRPPEGDWVCLDAETTLGGGSVGMATSAVYDARGLVARSSQALLITKR